MEDITDITLDKTLKKRLTISLDYSVLSKLDKRNRSGDVERILKQHFQNEGFDMLYDKLKQRLQKEGLIANQNTPQRTNVYRTNVYDEELENYRTNYADDGFQFRRYNGQIQVNRPPSRDWAGVEVLNF